MLEWVRYRNRRALGYFLLNGKQIKGLQFDCEWMTSAHGVGGRKKEIVVMESNVPGLKVGDRLEAKKVFDILRSHLGLEESSVGSK